MTLRKRQAGFTMISAIFLLVVLSALGAFLVRFTNVEQIGAGRDVEAVRAYRAAMTAAEYVAYQVLQAHTCSASQTLAMPTGGLRGYAATVTCTDAGPYTDGADTVTLSKVTAIACNHPDASNLCPSSPNGLTDVERRVDWVLAR